MGQRMKDQKLKAWGLIWFAIWICYRGRTRTASKNFSILLKLRNVVSKLVQLKHVTEGAWGRSPQAAGGFFVIFWKKMAILMRFESHFARFQSHLKQQNF